ncbi:MAG: DUF933 domain-containing protein [Betaproteobacteria bacterium]|nr:DUF933 domain-containing protein [Betaproteobacteria bacterium]
MGGTDNGVGNVTPAAEYNFYVDPEAAKIYYPGGKVPTNNAILKNPDLAKTMEIMGDKGPKAFYEAEIADMSHEDKAVFLADMGMNEPGLNRVIRAAFTLLGLQTYFTAGPKEVRAWTIRKGFTAPQAAGVIHTDFERGFIRAETIAFPDYIQYKGESGSKEAGKMRLEGKDYVVRDGDVMHFRFNV